MSGYIDKNKLLESLSREDIIHIIKELGSDYKEDSQKNICCSTALCHKGDSPYKLVYYPNETEGTNRGRFFCYTCGSSFDLIEFVIRAHTNQGYSMNYYKALRWIASTTGKVNIYGEVKIEKKIVDLSWIQRIKQVMDHKYGTTDNEEINENILDIFANYTYEPWTHEYISYKSQIRYEVGYYGLNNSITIPHRNSNGALIGVRQRYLDTWDIDNIGKYTPVQIEGRFLSHRLGNELYGLWVTKDQIQKSKQVIIVEAEKSVMQGYTFYDEESIIVACCGSNISNIQFHLLLDLGVNQIIYAPDRDYNDAQSFEAEAWYNQQVKKVKNFVPYCDVYLVADIKNRLEYKQSPTDCGKEIFEELLNEKIQITDEEIER